MAKNVVLQSVLEECRKHAIRLDFAHRQMKSLLPFDAATIVNLPDEMISYLDQYIFRFSKLQDALGNKLFKAVLSAVGEDYGNKPFIDIFHRLEQLDVLRDDAQWNRLRILRNEIAHDYDVSDNELAEKMNELLKSKDSLKEYFTCVSEYCRRKGLIDGDTSLFA